MHILRPLLNPGFNRLEHFPTAENCTEERTSLFIQSSRVRATIKMI